ncbi:helix-turn-helix domain-containing protein [Actinomadura madurae]|uniref:DNA-binding transcriptional regulator, XRE-family HTH domain n=1 Tax=Actinomadura madurae TaxID=1993 RepID=A0A1I5ISW7_9ACTN|nr:helix-turn-helix transcriptional regulator [Actinomadura madurae]SFO63460.1 DNA-binding transcriptional regulator, XRE-family HTH domain [Actinomadura madurae]SPT58372.1 transcriptional regulator, y4mF family [Actinomadura madurae]
MTSPFVRRRRLGAELRTLREQSGMTADELARRIYRSRMTISKLENARCRPDIGDIVKIMKILGVTGDRFDALFKIACDAAERGWWDNYGDAMGPRQRIYADLESGAASIREYNQFTIPGTLQTPRLIQFLIEMARNEGAIDFIPDRLLQARIRRQEHALGPHGPRYEAILDEVVIRRPTAPSHVMLDQLRYLIETALMHPRATVLVLPVEADFTGRLLPKSAFSLYTFPDPADPPMAVVDTVSTDIIHTEREEVMRYNQRYEHLRQAAHSGAASIGLLTDAADRLENRIGRSP